MFELFFRSRQNHINSAGALALAVEENGPVELSVTVGLQQCISTATKLTVTADDY